MPFREIAVSFDEGTRLIATRNTATQRNDRSRLPLTFTCERGGAAETFQPSRISVTPKDLRMPISAIEDFIPVLSQIGPRKWHNIDTGSILDLDDVLATFGDELPADVWPDQSLVPEWLQGIRDSIAVRFIDTERLTRSSQHRRPRRPAKPTRTVRHYSQQLSHRIQRSIAEYGALSQSLDRTFPARLVTDRAHSGRSVETLRQDLDAIEQKRSRLEEVGLLAGEQPSLAIPDL